MYRITDREIKLARKIAKKYAKNNNLDSEELMSYALEALTKASQKYNPEKNDFQKYASVWVRKNLSRYWRDRSQVPRSIQEKYFKINKLIKQGLSNEEICDRLKLSKVQIESCYLLMKYYYYQRETICLDEKRFRPSKTIPDFNYLLSSFALRPVQQYKAFKEKIHKTQYVKRIGKKNRKKKTIGEVREYATINAPGYELLSTEYQNNHTKLSWRCDKGHEYLVTFEGFQRGSRCTSCSGRIRKRKTIEEVRKYAEINAPGYELLSTEYQNNHTKLSWRCDKGHEYLVTFEGFQRGSRCTSCSGRIRKKNNII
ncbi:MAG: sigma-70 family RNA polymerase sigma factor [Waterburya sp.]